MVAANLRVWAAQPSASLAMVLGLFAGLLADLLNTKANLFDPASLAPSGRLRFIQNLPIEDTVLIP